MASPRLVAAAAQAADPRRTAASVRVQRLYKLAEYNRAQGNKLVVVSVLDLEALIVTAAVKLELGA